MSETPPPDYTLARDFYAIYCASSGGKNYQGLPCPAWPDLPQAVRDHWYTVSRRAASLVNGFGEPAACLDHLPDPAAAYETWLVYSGIAPAA